MDSFNAPFRADQVDALNAFQRSGLWHPFTCGVRREHPGDWPHQDEGVLVATISGWVCPVPECAYTQDWAWDFMADSDWLDWHRLTHGRMFGS